MYFGAYYALFLCFRQNSEAHRGFYETIQNWQHYTLGDPRPLYSGRAVDGKQ